MEFKTGLSTTASEWKTPPRVCRCCLSEGCYKDISTEYYWMGEKELYSEMLRECFDITIKLQDNTSSARLICEVCITRLRDAANFKKQVVLSEKRFADHLRCGTSLSMMSATSAAESAMSDIKIESIKDETVISDDDPPDGPDDYIDDDDPDYDESDSLPLKYEALKKESMSVDISFGDEIPVLNNPEMTIRRVSTKTKDKTPTKKKTNKKELTIKPVKASGSKTKNKEEKVKKDRVKPAKTAKKDGAAASSSWRNDACIIISNSTCTPFSDQSSIFKCFYCKQSFYEFEELREHCTTHPQTYEDVRKCSIKTRVRRTIYVDIHKLRCKICFDKFPDLAAFKQHLKDKHKKQFSDEFDGLIPFDMKKNENTYSCFICSERFFNFRTMNVHMNEHSNNFICNICGSSFVTVDRLRSHSDSHKTKQFSCNVCGKTFSTMNKRIIHVSSTHEKKKRLTCPRCPERFFNYHERLAHLEEVHGIMREYKCTYCSAVYKIRSVLTNHIKVKHNPSSIASVYCPICNKEFKEHNLKKHMHIHTQEKKYECVHCNKKFKTKRSVNTHLRCSKSCGARTKT